MSSSACGRNFYQPSPLPLLRGTTGSAATVLEQPCDLSSLTQRYADFAGGWIQNQTQAAKPWLLYASWNHVHVTDAVPNYNSPLPPPGYSQWQYSAKKFCNSSKRGGTGDAVQELDDGVGQIMAAIKGAGADENTISFFSSGEWPILYIYACRLSLLLPFCLAYVKRR